MEPGSYVAKLRCDDGPVESRVEVGPGDGFHLVLRPRRLLIADHVKPRLVVDLKGDQPRDVWWVRLSGIYNGNYYEGTFAPGTGEAYLIDPEPGSYVVAVGSSNGYSCVKYVDLVEFTKRWSFDRASCSFEFDRFAHSPAMSPAGTKEGDRWYRDVDEYYRRLIEEIRRAASK